MDDWTHEPVDGFLLIDVEWLVLAEAEEVGGLAFAVSMVDD